MRRTLQNGIEMNWIDKVFSIIFSPLWISLKMSFYIFGSFWVEKYAADRLQKVFITAHVTTALKYDRNVSVCRQLKMCVQAAQVKICLADMHC